MKQLKIADLRAGMTLDEPMYSAWGQKLLDAGVELTGDHIRRLRRADSSEIFMASDASELEQAGVLRRVERRQLQSGRRATSNWVNASGRLLIEAGEEIEDHHLDAMAVDHRIFEQHTEAARPVSPTPVRLRLTDPAYAVEQLERAIPLDQRRIPASPSGDPLRQEKNSLSSPWPDRMGLVSFREGLVATIRRLYARIEAGRCVPVECFSTMVDQLLDVFEQYPRRFCQLGILFRQDADHIPDHALTTTVLAIAAGDRMNWERTSLYDLALAAMLMDLGMLRVPRRIHHSGAELDTMDLRRVHEHPQETLEMLQQVLTIPAAVQLAAYQHHEREDGSGYPARRLDEQIIDLARMLAVVDSFAAMTEHRSHRDALLPHDAMRRLLDAATAGSLWKPAVKALIQAAGLFPVGSKIRLSDGRSATVIAANPSRFDRPVVSPSAAGPLPDELLLDLAHPDCAYLSIIQAPNPGH